MIKANAVLHKRLKELSLDFFVEAISVTINTGLLFGGECLTADVIYKLKKNSSSACTFF